jgi:hypothetical protein
MLRNWCGLRSSTLSGDLLAHQLRADRKKCIHMSGAHAARVRHTARQGVVMVSSPTRGRPIGSAPTVGESRSKVSVRLFLVQKDRCRDPRFDPGDASRSLPEAAIFPRTRRLGEGRRRRSSRAPGSLPSRIRSQQRVRRSHRGPHGERRAAAATPRRMMSRGPAGLAGREHVHRAESSPRPASVTSLTASCAPIAAACGKLVALRMLYRPAGTLPKRYAPWSSVTAVSTLRPY